tara:strand:- start:325 stop:624 length:300 start_codon:yes stop_codon:yes gene_type:complete
LANLEFDWVSPLTRNSGILTDKENVSMPVNVTKLMTIRTAKESFEARYAKLDDADVLHCVEMARDGRMMNPAKIEAIVKVAHERKLLAEGSFEAATAEA